MKIATKEDNGLNITCFLDGKRYKTFLKDLKKLGNKYEHESNSNKLNFGVVFYGRRMPYIDVKGWTSRVVEKDKGTHHVLFLDYDEILYHHLKEELEYVCRKHNMSPFYVFKTFEDKEEISGNPFGNYIAISLTKKRFGEIVDIQSELTCDAAYKKIPLIYRWKCWVLRLGKKSNKSKPKFKEIIGDTSDKYAQPVSEAHLRLIEKLYPQIKKLNYTNLDGNKELELSKYRTASL